MARQESNMDAETVQEIYRKAGTPGEQHKLLANLEGNWTTRSRAWLEPDKPPRESAGTCEQTLILDGRYLRQEYHGEMMGQPYNGINFLGYNNHTKKYESVWIDSLNTGMYYFVGSASADGKTITQECNFEDPVRGPSVWRSVTKIRDNNTQEFEMYITPRGGKATKMMEMTITRAQAAVRKAA